MAGRSFRHYGVPGTPRWRAASATEIDADTVPETATVSATDAGTATVTATDPDTDTDTVSASDPAYSHLSASMGFKLAALIAG